MSRLSHGKVIAAAQTECLRPGQVETFLDNILIFVLLDGYFALTRARLRRVRRQAVAVIVAASFFWLPGLHVAGMTSSASAAQRKRGREVVTRPETADGKMALPSSPVGKSPLRVKPAGALRKTDSKRPTTAPQTSPSPTPTPTPAPTPVPSTTSGQKVKLYYLREGTKIAAALNEIAKPEKSEMHGLSIGSVSEDEILLIGTDEKREIARRIIATLDLPRPGVQMEMWGIQISSRKPDDLAEVMQRVREEINRTQQAVRETYNQLQELARNIPDSTLDAEFKSILVEDLRYTSALDPNRSLSLSDILLRLIAAQDPVAMAEEMANNLDSWLRANHPNYVHGVAEENMRRCKSKRRDHPAVMSGGGRRPFERFFRNRGLIYNDRVNRWEQTGELAKENAKRGKVALLHFALQYGRLVHDPQNFSPYYLQQSAGALNTRLQTATDALNLDMQDLFVAPTLDRIRKIVGEFCDVEYAQVGKTSVASLSGVPTVVTSYSVNAFDVTPPLRLSDLLTKAKTLSDSASPFVPNAATQNLVGAMPLAQVIGLIGAFGEERSVWRELKAGVSLTITPNVLRNMTSAELQVDLKTGDPQAGTREAGVRPLTRVSQHDVNTKVYVNALDFFDLSAFGSQSTLNGGRGYVPIIGPVWRGLFGEAPVIGTLFSWKKNPQTVYSQSLVLTTSFITPTAMGVALLVPTDFPEGEKRSVTDLQEQVECYEARLFRQQVKRRKDGSDPCQQAKSRLSSTVR